MVRKRKGKCGRSGCDIKTQSRLAFPGFLTYFLHYFFPALNKPHSQYSGEYTHRHGHAEIKTHTHTHTQWLLIMVSTEAVVTVMYGGGTNRGQGNNLSTNEKPAVWPLDQSQYFQVKCDLRANTGTICPSGKERERERERERNIALIIFCSSSKGSSKFIHNPSTRFKRQISNEYRWNVTANGKQATRW